MWLTVAREAFALGEAERQIGRQTESQIQRERERERERGGGQGGGRDLKFRSFRKMPSQHQ